MDDVIYIGLQLLEILYRYIGEFTAWSQLYESVQPGLNFPSPRLAIPWMRLFIRAIENDLARVIEPGRYSRSSNLVLACQQFLLLRLLIDRARFSRNI